VDETTGVTPPLPDVVAIDRALDDLAAIAPRHVRVVECRFFGGLTIPETAEALGISHTTVSEDWRFARAWLHRALSGGAGGSAA
jgi:RNA polymerase sigma-70 factor, ECF subfamily